MAVVFFKRALTLATVGVLSGAAITIATDGVIQSRLGDNKPESGVTRYRLPGEQFKLVYPHRHHHTALLPIELFWQNSYDFERGDPARTFKLLTGAHVIIGVGAETGYAALYSARPSVSINVLSQVTAAKQVPAQFNSYPEAALRSTAFVRYTPAGAADYAHQSTIRIEGQATVQFRRAPVEVEDAPRLPIRSYTFASDSGPRITGSAQHAFTGSINELVHEGRLTAALSGAAEAWFIRSDRPFVEFRYDTDYPLAVGITAWHSFQTGPEECIPCTSHAAAGILHVQLSGAATVAFAHDVLPYDDDDDDVLLLFAKAMLE